MRTAMTEGTQEEEAATVEEFACPVQIILPCQLLHLSYSFCQLVFDQQAKCGHNDIWHLMVFFFRGEDEYGTIYVMIRRYNYLDSLLELKNALLCT